MIAFLDSLTYKNSEQLIFEKYPHLLKPREGRKSGNFRKVVTETVTTNKITEELLVAICNAYRRLYTNIATIDNMFSKDVRAPISKKYGKDSDEYKLSKKLVKITFEEKTQVIEKQQQKVVANNTNCIPFNQDHVISLIKDNIDSENPIRCAVALLIASGCRPIELFVRSTFTKNEDLGPNWIHQEYIAKSKNKTSLNKPLIEIDSETFIEKVNDLREYLESHYNVPVKDDGNLVSAILFRANQEAKKMFNYKESTSLYTCRKLYGNISYKLFSGKTKEFGENPSLNVWLNGVLGHAADNLVTSHNYSNITLNEEEEDVGVIKNEQLLDAFEKMEPLFNKDLTLKKFKELAKGITTRENVTIFYKMMKEVKIEEFDPKKLVNNQEKIVVTQIPEGKHGMSVLVRPRIPPRE